MKAWNSNKLGYEYNNPSEKQIVRDLQLFGAFKSSNFIFNDTSLDAQSCNTILAHQSRHTMHIDRSL